MRTSLSMGTEFGVANDEDVRQRKPFWKPGKGLFIEVPAGVKTNSAGERRQTYRDVQIATEGQFRANSVLRKDEWVMLDTEAIETYRQRLVIFGDVRDRGLVHSVGGLGTLISEWENISAIIDSSITMDGESAGRKDRVNFGLNGVPIPVLHSDYDIMQRVLMSSRREGQSLDVTAGVEAGQALARTSEKMIIDGVSSVGSSNSAGNTYQIYGLTNFPNRSVYSTLSDWSNTGTTTEDILDDILAMLQQLETDERRFGPFTIYVPPDASFQFHRNFVLNGQTLDKTLEARVVSDKRVDAVKVADQLESGNVLVIQLDRTVLDLATGAEESNIQWESGSGWTNHFQFFSAWAPRLKTDYDGHCGILHATEGS